MWVRGKTKKFPYKEGTGCCSGLFGVAPDDEGMVELGYLRKAYDQQELICSTISSYDPMNDNCVNMQITAEEVDTILTEAQNILETHTFNEEGEDLETSWVTWMSKSKWEDLIEYFKKAKELLREDPAAEIYYCQWY